MEVDPYNPKLFSNRCTAYLYLQDYEKALQDAKKCVSIDPDWYKGHVQLGSCYMGLKNYKEAINAYKKGKWENMKNGMLIWCVALPLAESKETVQKLVDKVYTVVVSRLFDRQLKKSLKTASAIAFLEML